MQAVGVDVQSVGIWLPASRIRWVWGWRRFPSRRRGGAAQPVGRGGGSRSGLMSKSMPFLGASIFLKGNLLSEGGFPVPSESHAEKGVCTKRSRNSKQGPKCGGWTCSLRPKCEGCRTPAGPPWSSPFSLTFHSSQASSLHLPLSLQPHPERRPS